jgi:hypothetical protein
MGMGLYRRFPKLEGFALDSARQPENLRGDLVEREHALGQAGLRNDRGHAPDHGGGFILHQDGASMLADEATSGKTV